jgi:hypothetical protein
MNFGFKIERHLRRSKIVEQHVNNLLRRTVAEQLPERLLVIGNPPRLHSLDEVTRRKPLQNRNAEMRIVRQKLFRARMYIRKITPPAAGDTNFLASAFGVIDPASAAQNIPAAPAPMIRVSKWSDFKPP